MRQLIRGLTDTLKTAFPNITPAARPKIEDQEIKDPQWLVGFADGESCFLIRVQNSSAYKSGSQVKLTFTIVQHYRNEKLLKSLVEYWGCGKYYVRREGFACDFVVTKLSDITEKILPFFDKYPIQGLKKLDYLDFKRVAVLMQTKSHLIKESEQIREIKSGMNRGR